MKEKASERFETTLSPQCEQRMIVRRKYFFNVFYPIMNDARATVGLPKVNAKSFVRERIVSKIINVSIFDRTGIKDNIALEVTSSGKNTTHRRPGRRHLPLPPCPCFCSFQAFSFSPRLFFFLQTYVHLFSSVSHSLDTL